MNIYNTLKQDILRIFRRQSPVSVLGPHKRAAIWVQGCEEVCPGCVVPESWDRAGGETITVAELANWIISQKDIEGITLSGGEPMLQAAGLGSLIDMVRRHKDLGVVCYTGSRWERLGRTGTPAQKSLLERVDLLIDGPYIESEHGDLLWRGSSNQRLLPLTERYRHILTQHLAAGDRSAGIEFGVDLTGAFYFTGVPALKGFRAEFEARMERQGITIKKARATNDK
ncbi:4Fe-4S single cluster domain-containing protein [Kamptonema formosum]|uniref:4Fe-4S single cluster domain-containing protein n=1 Tax=Kamptonema formosum TaxID=331992 RepID=UPI0003476DDB|nr:4Fe-4S single cluster domain-containing protein [Oscillatoria sp. PCC 10802]